MRPIYECTKIVGLYIAQNQPTIAQESPHYNVITILFGGESIFEVFHPM